MFAVRAALEGLAAAIIGTLPNRTPGDPAAGRTRRDGSAPGRSTTWSRSTSQFHRVLCELTGNTTLVRTWEALAGSIRMSIMFAGTDRALTNMSVPRHQHLVDAIASGDAERPDRGGHSHARGRQNL